MAPFDATATLSGTPLTIGWIEQVLKNNINGSEKKLKEWSAEMIGVGQGFASHIFRVKLAWEGGNGHNLPASVIVKVPTAEKVIDLFDDVAKDGHVATLKDEDKDKMTELWIPNAHSNEIFTLTFLNSFHDVHLATPKLFISQEYKTDQPGHACLIMEDFTHGAPPSILDGLNKVQLYQVVDALATIQAVSMNENDKLSTLFSVPDEFLNSFSAMLDGVEQQFYTMAPDFGFDELFPKLKWIFEAEGFLAILKYGENKGLPKVLIHGDMWAGNMLVEKDEEGKPTGDFLSLIDWQTAHWGFVAEDLCRLLVTSTTGELRRQETDNVLRAYFDQFRNSLSKRGKECSLTFDIIKDAYDFNFPFAVGFFVVMLPMMLTIPAFADHSGKPAPHCVQALMLRAKLAMEDVLELKRRGRC